MQRAQTREKLVDFLRTIARPGGQFVGSDDDVNLYDTGSLDSLAVIQIIVYLEAEHGVDMAANNIDPGEFGSISEILNVIERTTG